MQDQTIGEFLEQLAARVPAPGGGAAAAVHAAQAAALLGMVARYTTGDKYAEHAEPIADIIERADRTRTRALELAEADAAAFGAVGEAYKLPKGTDEEKAARSQAISAALADAAEPPTAVIRLVLSLAGIAQQLLKIGNRSVITDVAAAAEAMRAAATTARVNIEVNIGGISDEQARKQLVDVAAEVEAIVTDTEAITTAVRAMIAR